MNSKRLALLRHAKSSWDDPNLSDPDRPLTSRGRRAATRLGGYLRKNEVRFDLVLCSSSTRTVQTVELLRLKTGTEILIEDDLYAASSDELLSRLRRVPDRVTSLLLVGHNPGLGELAMSLAGDHGTISSFPTASFVDLRMANLTWDSLRPGVCDLMAFITPRDLI